MKIKRRFPLICFVLIAALLACFSSSTSGYQAGNRDTSVSARPLRTSVWNEQALLLSGLPLSKGSLFSEISSSPAFRKHALAMDALWREIKRKNLDPMAAWRKKHIPCSLESNAVLYPLSGADLPNAYVMFPHAGEYLFIALEPAGYVPDLNSMSESNLQLGLAAIRRAVWALAANNYQQSRVLREELTNRYLPGTLPLFLLFAARLNLIVQDVQAIEITKKGALESMPMIPRAVLQMAPKRPPKRPIRGLRLVLHDLQDGQNKTLIYLQFPLSTESVQNSTPEGNYLLSLKNRNTMLKSAVYILHSEQYRPVRDYLLAHSNLIIQDDSGIPYKFFAQGDWEEHLFGTYTKALPLGGIPNPPQQPLLAQRYRERSSPLSFPFGYGILRGKGKSNLMLFIRKQWALASRLAEN